MGSHTDRVGTEAYNEGLSERRAKSVVDYLVGAGIAADRLTWKGYGKSVPKTVTPRINREYPQFETGTVLTPEFIDTLGEGMTTWKCWSSPAARPPTRSTGEPNFR